MTSPAMSRGEREPLNERTWSTARDALRGKEEDCFDGFANAVDVAVEFGGGWDPGDAIRLLERLEKWRPGSFERHPTHGDWWRNA